MFGLSQQKELESLLRRRRRSMSFPIANSPLVAFPLVGFQEPNFSHWWWLLNNCWWFCHYYWLLAQFFFNIGGLCHYYWLLAQLAILI
jgi:hypothetical protein